MTQTYPRFAGDTAGPFIRDLARALVRGGDQVSVLTPHARCVPARWCDDGVLVRSFRYAPVTLERVGYSRSLDADERIKGSAALSAPLYALGARRALRRWLRAEPHDLVHAHWVVPNALIAASVRSGLPLVVGLHGSDVFLAEKPPVRPLVRWALARASRLTGCSPELVERVCALGFDPQRADVIPYGVDSAVFSPDRQRRGIWRQRLGIPEAAPVVVSVGRMATKKGYQVLFAGLDSLFARCPELHLVLAGAGDRLEVFRAQSAPWGGRVHLPGAVLRDTLPDMYRAADIFVLPAVHDPKGNVDGLPNVILEAMASGLPVVSTAISGIPLAITDATHGRLVAEGDTDALIEALVALVEAPEQARLLGRAGRAKARQALSWDAVASRYRQVYERALEIGVRRSSVGR